MCTFISPTYGNVNFEQIIQIMRSFYNKHSAFGHCNVIIGTDSQNFSDTKMVSAIVMQCEGKGGIYFYCVEMVPRIADVRQKLNYETQRSLEYADKLLEVMLDKDEDLFSSISFSIHIDAGHSDRGKTKELIPSLVGWIHACGYECQVKPDSFAASTIANRISK